ncbi:aromatic amino acid lyase [soil metagenome]
MLILRHASDLDPDTVRRVAWGDERLHLDAGVIDHVAAQRAGMLSALEGRQVYGVTTGTGYRGRQALDAAARAHRQYDLLIGRAVGGAPYLPRGEARAVLVTRLVNFLSGHAGVTPELCRFLVDRINDGFVPAIPRRSIGCAGEIIPLAHAFQTLVGIGSVLTDDGGVEPAAAALRRRDLDAYVPAEKEGIALLAGAPATAAVAIARHREATVVSRQLAWSAACAIDALRAPLEPYGAAAAALSADELFSRVTGQLRARTQDRHGTRRESQAPVSFRVAPQVLTHLWRTLNRLADDIGRNLASVTDSPAFVGGAFVSTGGFHAIEVAAGLDALAAALVRGAELAAQRIHRLLDSRFTGLPDQLTAAPGAQAGLVVIHKRVVGAINELRRRSQPVSIGLVDTSLGQEDAMTFSFEASENVREIAALVRDVVACELLVARQAWALRNEEHAPGLGTIAQRLISVVPPLDDDRPLGRDVDNVRALLTDERLFR